MEIKFETEKKTHIPLIYQVSIINSSWHVSFVFASDLNQMN